MNILSILFFQLKIHSHNLPYIGSAKKTKEISVFNNIETAEGIAQASLALPSAVSIFDKKVPKQLSSSSLMQSLAFSCKN